MLRRIVFSSSKNRLPSSSSLPGGFSLFSHRYCSTNTNNNTSPPSPPTHVVWSSHRLVATSVSIGTALGIFCGVFGPWDMMTIAKFGQTASLVPLAAIIAKRFSPPKPNTAFTDSVALYHVMYCSLEGLVLTPAIGFGALAQTAFAASMGSVFFTFIGPVLAVFIVWLPLAYGLLFIPEGILALHLLALYIIFRFDELFQDDKAKKKTDYKNNFWGVFVESVKK
eukprot:PhF_6_TR23764/c0_g1_i2/m.33225